MILIAAATALIVICLPGPLHRLGMAWPWAIVNSIVLAAAGGISAAEALGLF